MLVFLGATRFSWSFAWGAKAHAANYILPIFKPLKPRLVSTVFTEFPLFSGAFSTMPVILAVFISPICLYGRMIALKNHCSGRPAAFSVFHCSFGKKGLYDLRFPMIRRIDHFSCVKSPTPVSIELAENGLSALFSDGLFPSIRQNTFFYVPTDVPEHTSNLILPIGIEESDWITRTVFVETLRLATSCWVAG